MFLGAAVVFGLAWVALMNALSGSDSFDMLMYAVPGFAVSDRGPRGGNIATVERRLHNVMQPDEFVVMVIAIGRGSQLRQFTYRVPRPLHPKLLKH